MSEPQRLRQAPEPTPEELSERLRLQRVYAVQRFCYQLAAVYPKARWPQSILHAPGQRPPKPVSLSFKFNGPPLPKPVR